MRRNLFCALGKSDNNMEVQKKEKKPISIILLTWNRIELLKKTLTGIKERTKHPYKLIVVDNFSDDGTQDFLRQETKKGFIQILILNDINLGQTAAFNKAFAYVDSETFIVTQDDLIPPDLEPCWLEQMDYLLRKNKGLGGLCMRIQRVPNIHFDNENEITPCRKACPAYLRIQYKEDLLKLPNLFGNRMYHEDSHFQDLIQSIDKKCGFTTHIFADHCSYMKPNKGYGDRINYAGYNAERNKVPSYKPYPKIDPKTNIPQLK